MIIVEKIPLIRMTLKGRMPLIKVTLRRHLKTLVRKAKQMVIDDLLICHSSKSDTMINDYDRRIIALKKM